MAAAQRVAEGAPVICSRYYSPVRSLRCSLLSCIHPRGRRGPLRGGDATTIPGWDSRVLCTHIYGPHDDS